LFTLLSVSVYYRPQAAENSPYPPKLCLPPNIRRKKFGLAGYQPNFDEELEIRSMERGICPIAVFYFALKRSFFNI